MRPRHRLVLACLLLLPIACTAASDTDETAQPGGNAEVPITDDGADPDADGAGTDPSAAGALEVEDDVGIVTLEAAADRVVCLVDYCGDLLAAFDHTPVGAQVGTGGTRPDYLGATYVDLPSVGAYAEPSLEAIADLEPDLIVGLTTAHTELRDALDGIAPTLVIEPRDIDDVRTHLAMMGTLLGLPDAGEVAASQLDARLDAAAEAVDAGTSCLVVFSNGTDLDVLPLDTVTPSALDEVCDYASRETTDGTTNFLSSDVEGVLAIDPDHLFVAAMGEADVLDTLATNPLWGELSAVRSDQVHEVDPTVWMFGRGPTALELVLDGASGALSGR